MAKFKKIVQLGESLQKKQREALLELIDLATEETMDKLLAEMEANNKVLLESNKVLQEQYKNLKMMFGFGFSILTLILSYATFFK